MGLMARVAPRVEIGIPGAARRMVRSDSPGAGPRDASTYDSILIASTGQYSDASSHMSSKSGGTSSTMTLATSSLIRNTFGHVSVQS